MGRKLGLATLVIATFLVVFAPVVHAQSITTRTDQASYRPGGTGTLYVTIVNTSPTETLEMRNITVYFPWAGYVDGKWASGGNVSINLSPYQVLTTSASPGGGNIYTTSVQFNIPSWFGSSSGSSCPSSTATRYGIYGRCVLVGTNQNGLQYEGVRYNFSMAIPTYQAPSFTTTLIPTGTFILLVVSTALLFMWWTSLKRLEAKNN